MVNNNFEKFSFTNSKPPIDFFAQNSLQFGRRAKRGEPTKFDFSLLVLYSENSSNAFRRLRRRREAPKNSVLHEVEGLSGFAAILKTAKEPVKNIGSNHIL
ncbi:hypothetical protein KKH86_03980 [Patescibacteria group bacterium]|nr:hypothetical protein [Patescibacteria group bacterium]